MQNQMEPPLIVQGDRTLFLEVAHPQFTEVRNYLLSFAELMKSPASIHIYRITPLSLWNAAASGWTALEIINTLRRFSRYELALKVEESIKADLDKFGKLCLRQNSSGYLYLQSEREEYMKQLLSYPSIASFFQGGLQVEEREEGSLRWWIFVDPAKRGELKQQAIRLGFPIIDQAGYKSGERLELSFVSQLANGQAFQLREYQRAAVEAFYQEGSESGGHGTIILPCGAGKTIVGLAAIVKQQVATLILTSNSTSVRQWKQELLDKTTLSEQQIGEYTGDKKEIRPITITTYQMLTYRSKTSGQFEHLQLFHQGQWGFIIYDEVHLLPAPVFRATASIQSTRRLGLTATLVREDGKEEDVFSLIGPKRYELPWKSLEQAGYIAQAYCTEVRVPLPDSLREEYYLATVRAKMRIAQENPLKIPVLEQIIAKHQGEAILIIGQYIQQLEQIGQQLDIPVIMGKVKQMVRDRLYTQFKKGELSILAVSKVANFAIDLPDASVAIQISGMYGSRQEEAQRLGRILRPKTGQNKAYFYHLVTVDSVEEEYALKRRLFLMEQGYTYQIIDSSREGALIDEEICP